MDLFKSIQVFQQVVKSGSFTKAADELNISIAMASKHVTFLENHLQVRLLTRTSRRLHLTEVGENYLLESTHALELLEQAAASASIGTIQPKGTLKITLPAWLANDKLANWLHEYRQMYPNVTLALDINNHFVDLIEEGYDLALRATANPAPSLIVRPLIEMPFLMIATPTYLQGASAILEPNDLNHHHTLLPSYTDMEHLTLQRNEEKYELHLQAAATANDTRFLHLLVRNHHGIAFLPESLVEEDLYHGRLQQVLPDWTIDSVTIYAAYINREYLSAKVRTFIDFIQAKIQMDIASHHSKSLVG